MAGPKSRVLQQIRNLSNTSRTRRRSTARPLVTESPDAVNETLRASGTLQALEAFRADLEDRKQKVQALQTAQLQAQLQAQFLRDNYRARKKAEQELDPNYNRLVETPAELMTDLLVDAAIAREAEEAAYRATQPQIGPTNPVWYMYNPETRRALGYYTLEEREQAARLNDMRSNTVFGNVMPNFGRQHAYNNPGAEIDAFRSTAYYAPNAAMAGATFGLGFGLPSASRTFLAEARSGWNTAGNVTLRVVLAGTQAARAAAPVVTSPRWLTTGALLTAPVVAQASNGSGSITDYILPTVLTGAGVAALFKGFLFVRNLRNKGNTSTTTPSMLTTYRPDRRFFTWERPLSWDRRLRQAILDNRMTLAIDEWNLAVGDPAKELAFINKYGIRATEGTPLFTSKEVTRPKTLRVPKTETVQEPATDIVSSTLLGPDGKPLVIQRARTNADGSPVMQSVQREVRDALGNPVMYDKPILDDQGLPVMETVTLLEPVLGADGKQVVTYNPISSDDVPSFLLGNLGNSYTSNLPNASKLVLRGPTTSQRIWAGARNAGRLALFGTPLWFLSYNLLNPSSEDTSTNSSGDTSNENAQTDSVSSALPPGFRPIKGYNDSTGEMIFLNTKGDADTIIRLDQYVNRFEK